MQDLPQRRQQTISRSVQVSGFGLFGGVDVTVEFCPAEPNHGIVFERIDLVDAPQIPALIEYVVPKPRCTVISHGDATISVIEHVMAALAGLQIDNCLIRINAPEPPGCDGSSMAFVEALLQADIVVQDEDRDVVIVDQALLVTEGEQIGIGVQPPRGSEFEVGFLLDYGPGPISCQSLSLEMTPDRFIEEIAPCRTFVLETEVKALQANGIGRRATSENILVFGDNGPIENKLRFPDECVRHKILDCIGDFALLGCDLRGRFIATQSGHRLNHAVIREVKRRAKPPLICSTLPFPTSPFTPSSSRQRAAG